LQTRIAKTNVEVKSSRICFKKNSKEIRKESASTGFFDNDATIQQGDAV
jgi:hypothetical protein